PAYAANRSIHFAGEPTIRHNLSRGALMRDQPIGRAALPHGLLRTLERHAHIGDLAAQGLREDIGEFRETALGPGEFVNLARVRLRIEKNAGPEGAGVADIDKGQRQFALKWQYDLAVVFDRSGLPQDILHEKARSQDHPFDAAAAQPVFDGVVTTADD